MAKTYKEFEDLLCANVEEACSALRYTTSKAEKIDAITRIHVSANLLKEWLMIDPEAESTEDGVEDESYDEYKDTPKKGVEKY